MTVDFQPTTLVVNQIARTFDSVARRDGIATRVAAFELAWGVGLLAGPALAAIALHRRLPEYGEWNVGVRETDEDHRWRVGLRTRRFACLQDDEAAIHPDAMVVADVGVLRKSLQSAYLDGWGGEAVRAIASMSPVSERALWGMVASAWADAFGKMVVIGLGIGEAIAEAEAALAIDPRLFTLPVRMYTVYEYGRIELRHWRGVCCLAYQTPGDDYCAGACPLLPAGRLALRSAGAGR
jgi:hypothetical protein